MRILVGRGQETARVGRWLKGARVVVADDVLAAVHSFCEAWECEDPFDVAVLEGNSAWARLAVARFRHVERLLGVDQLHPIRVVIIDGRVSAWPGTARVDAFTRRPLSAETLNKALEEAGALDAVA